MAPQRSSLAARVSQDYTKSVFNAARTSILIGSSRNGDNWTEMQEIFSKITINSSSGNGGNEKTTWSTLATRRSQLESHISLSFSQYTSFQDLAPNFPPPPSPPPKPKHLSSRKLVKLSRPAISPLRPCIKPYTPLSSRISQKTIENPHPLNAWQLFVAGERTLKEMYRDVAYKEKLKIERLKIICRKNAEFEHEDGGDLERSTTVRFVAGDVRWFWKDGRPGELLEEEEGEELEEVGEMGGDITCALF